MGKPIFRHFGSLGAFLLAENRGKFHFFHVLRHFRAPPRTPILLKIRFFWLKIMSFQYGVTTNFNGADWPTVEGARAILVDLVVFTVELRVSTICRLPRRGPYLGRQLDFLKNSFSGGSQGTMHSGETHLRAFWVTGGIFIR